VDGALYKIKEKLMPLGKIRKIKEEPHVNKDCKGKIYRCRVESFLNSKKTIETRKSLRLLKSESCPGCETCGWIDDFLAEDIVDEPNSDYVGNIEHGKKYTIQGYWSPGPFEYPDDGDLEIVFAEVKED
jgi:hypothetical protein